MKNWIPQRNTIVFAALFTTFSILLYFLGIFMVNRETNKIEQAYINTESESSKIEKSISIKSALASGEAEIATLREFFIKKGDEVRFIETIENLGSRNSIQLKINSIDVKPKQDDPFKEDVVVKISFSGDWRDIINFVDGINKMYFGANIERLDLRANPDGGWSGIMDITVFREK